MSWVPSSYGKKNKKYKKKEKNSVKTYCERIHPPSPSCFVWFKKKIVKETKNIKWDNFLTNNYLLFILSKLEPTTGVMRRGKRGRTTLWKKNRAKNALYGSDTTKGSVSHWYSPIRQKQNSLRLRKWQCNYEQVVLVEYLNWWIRQNDGQVIEQKIKKSGWD